MSSEHLNGNNVYFEIDGEDMSPDWMEGELTGNVEEVEVTAGAGRKFKQFKEGLQHRTFSGIFQYNEVDMANKIKRLKPGTHRVVIGPEGKVPGKPKHDGMFIINSSSFGGQKVSKGPVNIPISGSAKDDPIVDFFDSGVFS